MTTFYYWLFFLTFKFWTFQKKNLYKYNLSFRPEKMSIWVSSVLKWRMNKTVATISLKFSLDSTMLVLPMEDFAGIRYFFLNYRGSLVPVSAVFGTPANRTIGKTALIGDWFSTNTTISDFWIFKVHFLGTFFAYLTTF